MGRTDRNDALGDSDVVGCGEALLLMRHSLTSLIALCGFVMIRRADPMGSAGPVSNASEHTHSSPSNDRVSSKLAAKDIR